MKLTAARAAVVIAAVYGYFLIFAQFSFVELLREGGMSEKPALGLMAAAGIAGGFLTAWRGANVGMIRCALGVGVLTAALAPFAKTMPGIMGIALMTGGALGVATVSLAAMVRAWCGVAWIGLGTGLGYACCNLPVVFTQSPASHAWMAAGFAIVGLLAVPSVRDERFFEPRMIFPLWGAVALFTALVWLDSAAFFIIQHTGNLKSATWGEGLLWRNAAVHLVVAVAAGLWLARGGARQCVAFSWLLLAVAALAVNDAASRGLAGWIYPAGVSLYSTALVAWPGWFSGAGDSRQAGWRAAWLFAVAGWFGSANGIGMAHSLQQVPPAFVAVAGGVVLAVMVLSDLKRWRSACAVGAVVLVAVAFGYDRRQPAGDVVARGRQVYLSEGCIHCHTQYVRPGSADEMMWGPVRKTGDVLGGKPVLIGNRRQGPDLLNVGARRSEAWLKLHFIQPQMFAPGSTMPSYARLFETGRGEDLIRYLRQSSASEMGNVVERASRWAPVGHANGADGRELFTRHCVVCHGPAGIGDGPVASQLVRKPANLVAGPFAWTPAGADLDLRVSRVIKFGLPGTDMPGHEVLADSQILALKDYILNLRGADGK